MIELLRRNLELIQHPVFLPAVLTGAALSVAAAVVGVFVLLRREALLALALPQVVAMGAAYGLRFLGGISVPPALEFLAVHTGWPTLPPAVVAVGLALLLIALSRRGEEAAGRGVGALSHTLLLPALYVAGLCISFLLIAGAQEHIQELQNRFTGVDIVTDVHVAEFTAPTLLACALLCAVVWRRWLLLSQARAAAQLAGLSAARWDSAFLSLLALVVLLGTNALGVVLVLAMLFLPAGAVLPWTRRIPGGLAAAAALALLLYVSGFVLSNEMNWPLSQSVGGLGFAVFLVSYLASRVFR